MVYAYIGLGSNLGDTAENLRVALREVEAFGQVYGKSKLYHSKAWGVTDQPDFCNAVLLLETLLSPQQLLKGLKDLEKRMGREESRRWGPRLIDLDILTYGEEVVKDENLTVPHLHMNERAFVLIPLCDIDLNFRDALMALPAESRAEVTVTDLSW
ncbi:hypothetical protein BH10CYA1_BH10CYA1_45190 [soil metagenome]